MHSMCILVSENPAEVAGEQKRIKPESPVGGRIVYLKEVPNGIIFSALPNYWTNISFPFQKETSNQDILAFSLTFSSNYETEV